MAARKKKLSAADAAYLKTEALRSGVAPLHDGALPGQIDMLTGEIAGSSERVEGMGLVAAHATLDALPTPERREPVAWPHIPDRCPECNWKMLIASGWALLKPREGRRLQCGNCGTIITVPQGAYDTLALAISAHFEKLNYVAPKKAKKSRGAG